MTRDTETELRELLHRHAATVDVEAVTGPGIRALAGRRRVPVAPLATAAAIVALVVGATVAVTQIPDARPAPAAPGSRSVELTGAATTSAPGPVPQCPSTVSLPGNPNTVCAIGTPSSPTSLTVTEVSPAR